VKGDKNMANSKRIINSLKALYRKGFSAGYKKGKKRKTNKKKSNKKESIRERVEHVENEEFRLLGDVGELARQILKIKVSKIEAIHKLTYRVDILEEKMNNIQTILYGKGH
jgi:Txe/YoeB family toxin of Txe-Axe toxin-antitoxin module